MVKVDKYHSKFKYACETEERDEVGQDKEVVKKVSIVEKLEPEIITNDERGANLNDPFRLILGQTMSIDWSELELAAVCLIELHTPGQICLEDLRNIKNFEEKFANQVKRLKELGIDLKLEKLAHDHPARPIDVVADLETDEKETKKSKSISFIDT